MECYILESNKQFLYCRDAEVLEVYEIDGLYIAPVRQKNWTHVETVRLGEGQKFELLRIGDGEIIGGWNLKALMNELMCLGMMVNREGLCFLKNPQSNISDQCQAGYYRMFDLFDWSKYYVKSKLNTRWARNDIVTGRPMLEMLKDKDAELIENKRMHLGELVELKCKHSQDIEDLKRTHSQDIEDLKRTHSQDAEDLKRKHSQDIEKFERQKEEALKAKEDDLGFCERKIKEMNRELELYCYKSENGNFEEFYSNLADHLRVSCPASKFLYSKNRKANPLNFYSPPGDHIYHLVLIPVGNTSSCHFRSVHVPFFPVESLDVDHWQLLEVELVFTIKKPDGAKSGRRSSLLYYNGEAYTLSKGYSVTYPSFCDNDNALGLEGCGVYHVLGVGFRLGFICLK